MPAIAGIMISHIIIKGCRQRTVRVSSHSHVAFVPMASCKNAYKCQVDGMGCIMTVSVKRSN